MKGILLFALATSSTAFAGPEPLSLPSSEAATELRLTSLVATNGLPRNDAAQALALAIDGRIAGPHGSELFARAATVIGNVISTNEGDTADRGYSDTSAALKLGGRGRLTRGRFTAVATAWTSLVAHGHAQASSNAFADRPNAFDNLIGLPDPYAIRDELAVGGALDVVMRIRCTFVQLEVGTALVRDARHGIVVDDLLVAAGFGGYITEHTTVALEYRLVQEPTGPLSSGATQQHVGVALGNVRQTRRVRVGLGAGLVLGFDLSHRF